MRRKEAPISASEMEVLQALWRTGTGTVRDVEEQLAARKRPWAYTTIQTLLNRLETKGYVTSVKDRLVRVFAPAVSREMLLGQRLSALAEELCDGSAAPLVRTLVQERKLSRDDIAELRDLIAALDGAGKAKTAKKSKGESC